METNGLKEDLLQFDGRDTGALALIEQDCRHTDGYATALVAMIDEKQGHLSSGATWLLRAMLESGGSLSAGDTAQLIAKLPGVDAWQAQLHLSQSVRYLDVEPGKVEGLMAWLRPLLGHDRSFLRAWSLDALWALAKSHPGLSREAQEALQRAHGDSAASVRARARRLASGKDD